MISKSAASAKRKQNDSCSLHFLSLYRPALQAFSIAEGTIKWLQKDENDRPRYRIRIAEVTSVGKKCATTATLLEVTSALLLEVSPKSLLEVSPKSLIRDPRSDCDIAEVSSKSVAVVTSGSYPKWLYFCL